ncbi:MAG TPA: hypothetical protein DGQ94_15590 [Pseudomonas sp.]|nr:hypothetical protein DZC31_05175 [Stenotrophomonas rhizophila]PIK79127.1 hypothetical protein CQW31_08660 [Pseudomonas sp. 382]HCV40107.1 hypothetical protein [Pseudomonas sp.]
MIYAVGAMRFRALDGPGRVAAGQWKSCQFEPPASVLTTPMLAFMRSQVTGAANHRIMRALYMEVRLRRTGFGPGCHRPMFGSPPLTTQECLV